MNDTTTAVMEDAAPIPSGFDMPDADGVFDVLKTGERICAPLPQFDCAIHVVEQADGWRASGVANLPQAGYGGPVNSLHPAWATRAEAVSMACEGLIGWCSEQKDRGSKKQRKEAAELQDWALEVEKRETAAIGPVGSPGAPAAFEEISPAVADGGPLEQGLTVLHTRTNEGELHQAALPQSLVDGELRMIPIDDVHESPWNPRQIYPVAAMEELTQSMRQSGFRAWQPILGRPRPEGGIEQAMGHRRMRAARAAGITMVPCVVRPMTDAEFERILNCDNSGREDVHPLHESAGWRAWMQRTGITVSEIAAHIGRSIEYVYQRLKYSDLIADAQAAFLDGKFKDAHAIEIARLPERYQILALDFMAPSWDSDRHVSVRQLKAWIAEHCLLSLVDCAFDPEDATLLPITGSCVFCPKRSGMSPELFSDLNDPDICTDPHCYRTKVSAAEARKPKAAAAPIEPPKAAAPRPVREPKPALAHNDESEFGSGAAVQQRVREEREAETARLRLVEERTERVYLKAVDAILEKVTAITPADAVAILGFLAGSFECINDLADKFAIQRAHPARWQDVVAVASKLSPAKIARMIVAGMLLDVGTGEGYHDTRALAEFAKRYKVNLGTIGKQVDAEIEERLGLRALNPPPAKPASPKDAIAKLPVMGAPKAAKPAPASSAPAAPPPAKAPAKKAAAKKAAPKAKAAPVKKSAPAKPAKAKGKK